MGFKVIIVGGSVSGLSLANMLEKFNIEYLLLEAYPDIAPQLGASMGLLPAGLRILDQLGCYDRIREMAGDCYYQPSIRLFDGRISDARKPVSFSEKLEYRTGYPQIFIDRQMLLQVLYDNLHYKDRVLIRKRVVRLDTVEGCLHVQAEDGSRYTGDIVVGADGVHSVVRKEMWRNSLEAGLDLFQADTDDALASDSKCIFGISKRPASLPTHAMQINAFFDGSNYMMLSAPQDRLYWFLFKGMKRATGSDIPRFTRDDEVALAEAHFGDRVAASTTFGDVYGDRLHTALVPFEEHVFKRWHFRRIITIGDAAHKVHPNTAQGGNGAIETAAVLVNALVRVLGSDSTTPPSDEKIEAAFAEAQEARHSRAAACLEQGRRTSSLSLRDTTASRLVVHFLLPWFGDRLIMWLAVRHAETGPVVEGLPLPCRRGVTLARGGHAAVQGGGGKVPWRLGALGVGVAAALLYFYGRWEGPGSLVTVLRGRLGHL